MADQREKRLEGRLLISKAKVGALKLKISKLEQAIRENELSSCKKEELRREIEVINLEKKAMCVDFVASTKEFRERLKVKPEIPIQEAEVLEDQPVFEHQQVEIPETETEDQTWEEWLATFEMDSDSETTAPNPHDDELWNPSDSFIITDKNSE